MDRATSFKLMNNTVHLRIELNNLDEVAQHVNNLIPDSRFTHAKLVGLVEFYASVALELEDFTNVDIVHNGYTIHFRPDGEQFIATVVPNDRTDIAAAECNEVIVDPLEIEPYKIIHLRKPTEIYPDGPEYISVNHARFLGITDSLDSFGGATIAYQRHEPCDSDIIPETGEKAGAVFVYALSFCHSDDRYLNKVGAFWASRRLMTDKRKTVLVEDGDEEFMHGDFLLRVLDEVNHGIKK